MTHRRDLLAALSASMLAEVIAFSPSAFAQQAAGVSGKVWRVGIVPGGLFAPRKYQWDVFIASMQALGYTEGKNVRYEIRAPEAEGAPFDEPIAALVRLNVDVIVATGNKAAVAAPATRLSFPSAAICITVHHIASIARSFNISGGLRLQIDRPRLAAIQSAAGTRHRPLDGGCAYRGNRTQRPPRAEERTAASMNSTPFRPSARVGKCAAGSAFGPPGRAARIACAISAYSVAKPSR